MTYIALPPFSAWAGPRQARILFVAEAWGENEAKLKKPLVGEAGKELWRMLGQAWPDLEPGLHQTALDMMKYDLAWVPHREAWMASASIAYTNVLNLRPPSNKIEYLCGSKIDVGGKAYALPAIQKARYLRPEYLPELSRLHREIIECKPNLVVALGATATWALLRATNIGSIRGATALGNIPEPFGGKDTFKVLPTYHPAGVLRQWNWRPIVITDLIKVRRQSGFAELRRPQRFILFNPTIEEVENWTADTLASRPNALANDIETGFGQIKCMSFARSRSEGLVIPFIDPKRPDWNYWPTLDIELRAWRCAKALLESGIPLIGQNYCYDLQYEMRLGLAPLGQIDDTMFMHHSWFPEMQKSLGFLGSYLTDEASWKLMRRPKQDAEKRDE